MKKQDNKMTRRDFIKTSGAGLAGAAILAGPLGPLAGKALAGDYFVATNGSDADAGSLESPFQSISKAVSVIAGSGCDRLNHCSFRA